MSKNCTRRVSVIRVGEYSHPCSQCVPFPLRDSVKLDSGGRVRGRQGRPAIDQFMYKQWILILTRVAYPIVAIRDPAIRIFFQRRLRAPHPVHHFLARFARTKGMSLSWREDAHASVARPGPLLAYHRVDSALTLQRDLIARPCQSDCG